MPCQVTAEPFADEPLDIGPADTRDRQDPQAQMMATVPVPQEEEFAGQPTGGALIHQGSHDMH